MALTRITSGGIAEGVVIKFDSNNTPATPAIGFDDQEGNPRLPRARSDQVGNLSTPNKFRGGL